MAVMSIFVSVPSYVTFTPFQPRGRLLLHPRALVPKHSGAAFSSRRLEARLLSPERNVRVVEHQEATSSPELSAVSVEKRKKRKPRPNFSEQALRRWSVRIPSQRTKFPWEEKEIEEEEDVKEEYEEKWTNHSELGVDPAPVAEVPVSGKSWDGNIRPPIKVASAPWARDAIHERSHLPSGAAPRVSSRSLGIEEVNAKGSRNSRSKGMEESFPAVHSSSGIAASKADDSALVDHPIPTVRALEAKTSVNMADVQGTDFTKPRLKEVHPILEKENPRTELTAKRHESLFVRTVSGFDASSVPWKSEEDNKTIKRIERRNTEKAERTVPEPELRRLRNDALRIKEITKVSSAGVTEALVATVREKWNNVEVVKLRFQGPAAINMKRTHDILEGKTGGLVIWRSGSLVVLYRGMSYKLPCVKMYSEKLDQGKNLLDSTDYSNSSGREVQSDHTANRGKKSKSSSKDSFEQASNEFMDTSNIDRLLDELGPRFKDWSGREPLPVDADLLPQVIHGYKPPLRCLPYKVKQGLRDAEMTYLRRLARSLPPHFALGRNRNHQGLAQAMVKLWEKSLIAKIAIKRGVLNACNDRMAEEIRILTGGILLSRNKEFIIFYRGNDFLTPSIAEALEERQKLANIRQDEEDQARQRASDLMVTATSTPKGPLIAGTLAETTEAKIHWAHELSQEERKKMMKTAAMAKQTSLIRFMERRLTLAEEKVKKAEMALAKVQEFLEPADLPSDIETVTDEERFLFRKIGLKMKAFLSLGRREVYDGTVENMHLHWKHRELVKIVVKGKSFAQVKHIAVSLEAESGGVLISLDKTTKGYAIVVYRGKNYQRPSTLRPKNLLTRKQALAHSIELQRREALKYHIFNLRDKINKMKLELEPMKSRDDNDEAFSVDDAFSFDTANVEEEGEEAYLPTYNSDGEEDPSQ